MNQQLYSACCYRWINKSTGEVFWVTKLNGKFLGEYKSQREALMALSGEIMRLATLEAAQ